MDIAELLDVVMEKQAERATVKMHPYGFLQLSLSDTTWRDSGYRLHIWSEELPSMKRPEFKIHNHIYGVKSKIVLGGLRDIQYAVAEDPQGDYILFTATEGKIINTGIKVSHHENKVSSITAGYEYIVRKGEFHSSESITPLTATLFQKSDADLHLAPQVIGPREYTTIEALSDERTFDQDVAWEIIGKAMHMIKKNM